MLVELDLSRNPQLKLDNLGTASALQTLRISNSSVGDLAAIVELGGLTALELDRNNIEDIESLAGLTALSELNLEQNDIHRLKDGLSGVQAGSIVMTGNPLYCSDIDEYEGSKPSGVTFTFESPCLLSAYGSDEDGDGILAEADNCPTIANPGQEDADGDRFGDVCDDDDDNDLILDELDLCPLLADPEQTDTDAMASAMYAMTMTITTAFLTRKTPIHSIRTGPHEIKPASKKPSSLQVAVMSRRISSGRRRSSRPS